MRHLPRPVLVLAAAFALVALASADVLPAAKASPTAAPPATSDASTTAKVYAPLRGQDISWPQCPKGMGIPSRPTLGLPMPRKSAKFVVIGLTNGPGFTPNPCLASQVRFARQRHLWVAPYSFTTYPTKRQLAAYGRTGPYSGTTLLSRLRNTGYAQARFNVANLRRAGLASDFVWIDVEHSRKPAPWSKRQTRNKAVVDGVLAGYRQSGLRVGLYAADYPWREIMGGTRYRLPEWRTVGPNSRRAALRKCNALSLQGGPIILSQWWDSNEDFNVTCPRASSPAALRTYFDKL